MQDNTGPGVGRPAEEDAAPRRVAAAEPAAPGSGDEGAAPPAPAPPTSQVLPGQETGGPLVNLSGQAVGIDVAGTGAGLHTAAYAVPIDQALAIAKRIDGQ